MNLRKAGIARRTSETNVELDFVLDGQGRCSAVTGVGFLDHMLHLLGHHAQVDIELKASGDLPVDEHHLVEDVGLVLGRALYQALGDKKGIERYGSVIMPMDEVLVAVALDLSGRPVFVSNYAAQREKVGDLSTELVNHFFRSLSAEARMTLHIRMLEAGENEHHRIEAVFKAFARALRMACRLNTAKGDVPSTKGLL